MERTTYTALMRLLPFGARRVTLGRWETRRGLDELPAPPPEDADEAVEVLPLGYEDGDNDEEVPGKVKSQLLADDVAATVVCARIRPCELDLPCVPTGTRPIALPTRSTSVGTGVPFSMSSARRGCLRASARKMCPPATGGAGVSVIASRDGLVEISRSAVFQTAGSSAWTDLREGAWARASTNWVTPNIAVLEGAGADGLLVRGPEGRRKAMLTVSCKKT